MTPTTNIWHSQPDHIRSVALDIQGIRSEITRIADAADSIKHAAWSAVGALFVLALGALMAIKAMQ